MFCIPYYWREFLGSMNKPKSVGIDIFRLQFPLIKLWEVTSNRCVLWIMYHAEYAEHFASD